ncbi:hypothetical protein EG832_02780 [bacterium]|nr:hypothetical protein [bacterium]
MKKVKLLIVLFVAAGFSVATVNAQTEKGTYSTIWHFEGLWLSDCIGETVTGDVEYKTFTIWQEGREWWKWQDKYWGTFTGDITGDIYTLSEVDQEHHVLNQNAGNFYFNGHWNIIRQGYGLIGTAHFMVHGTANDATWNKKDGNFASWVELNRFECK